MRLFVLLFLLAQLAWPTYALYERGGLPFDSGNLTEWPGEQVYFAWQMYSTSTTPATYELGDTDGSTTAVDPVERYGWLSGRAHYTGEVARRLCTEHPTAVAVRQGNRVERCVDE